MSSQITLTLDRKEAENLDAHFEATRNLIGRDPEQWPAWAKLRAALAASDSDVDGAVERLLLLPDLAAAVERIRRAVDPDTLDEAVTDALHVVLANSRAALVEGDGGEGREAKLEAALTASQGEVERLRAVVSESNDGRTREALSQSTSTGSGDACRVCGQRKGTNSFCSACGGPQDTERCGGSGVEWLAELTIGRETLAGRTTALFLIPPGEVADRSAEEFVETRRYVLADSAPTQPNPIDALVQELERLAAEEHSDAQKKPVTRRLRPLARATAYDRAAHLAREAQGKGAGRG